MASVFNTLRTANNMLRSSRTLLMQELLDVYRPTFNRNKDKIIDVVKEKIEQATKSELARKVRIAKQYYTLEMAPPSINDIQRMKKEIALVQEFMKRGCYKYLTVKQAWLLILVCTEVGLWFFIGETIGKLHIVGYKV